VTGPRTAGVRRGVCCSGRTGWKRSARCSTALLDQRSEAGPRRATGAGRCHAWCRAPGEAPVYSCQATELLQATRFVPARDPGVWVKDVRSRNAGVATALLSLLVLVFTKVQGASARLPRRLRIQDGRSWPWFTPTGERRSYPTLDRQPGELVEVRKQREIEATLNDKGEPRALRFSAEMLPYCGRQARVLARVDRIIDEKRGRMLKLRDCIILEDAWCQGTFRTLCRRKIHTYWQETWLRWVDADGTPA
jgi:hypothetical protein